MTPADIVSIAREWIGVPFHHQGRTRDGVDCAGLVVCVMAQADILPRGFTAPVNYGRMPQAELTSTVQRYCSRAVAPSPGLLALIRWPRQEAPSHVGILASDTKGRLTIVHAYQHAASVVENGFRSTWLRDAHSFWRLPGVTYE